MTLTPEEVQAVAARVPKWVVNLLEALDRRLNVKIVTTRTGPGDPNETISKRLAESRDRGEWEGRLGCSILDRYDPGHCDKAR